MGEVNYSIQKNALILKACFTSLFKKDNLFFSNFGNDYSKFGIHILDHVIKDHFDLFKGFFHPFHIWFF